MTHYPDKLSRHSRAYLLIVHLAFGLVLAATLALIFGWAVMFLWNAILPAVAPVRALTYWQGVGLLVLARLLVGGLGHGHHGGAKGHRHGEAWRKYDRWWQEIGQKSFDDYSGPQRGE